jgi:hypothetical protein
VNIWQVAKQVRYLLRARRWEGNGAYEQVFNEESVIVSSNPPMDALKIVTPPMAIIRIMGGSLDPQYRQNPRMVQRSIGITLATWGPHDPHNTAPIIGGARRNTATFGQESSEGRGLTEIEEEVYEVLALAGQTQGVKIQIAGATEQITEAHPQVGWISSEELEFDVWCNSARRYHPVEEFRASEAGGTVTLNWSLPPDRFDLFRIVIVRKAGSSPSSDVTDGTTILTSTIPYSGLATSTTNAPGAGTWTYTAFVAYDETADTPASAQRYAPSAYRSVTI